MTSPHWAFWVGGLALAAVPLVHWLTLGRMFAVSGRFTALVERVRSGPSDANLSADDLIAAIRAMTVDELGEDAVTDAPPLAVPGTSSPGTVPHVAFLLSLVAGGALSAATSSGLHLGYALRSETFPRIFGSAPFTASVVLLFGGILVGFGTRMAGGCTSGHGLCGVSRFQPGSLVSTAAFFGMGVALSLALAWLA